MHEEKKMSFTKWWTNSLFGHIVALQLFFAVPMIGIFTITGYNNGELTPQSLLRLLFAAPLGGLIAGILVWYLITLPTRRKYGRKS